MHALIVWQPFNQKPFDQSMVPRKERETARERETERERDRETERQISLLIDGDDMKIIISILYLLIEH